MKNYLLKLKIVLLPFFIITILSSLFWVFIYWLLIIKAELNIKDTIVEFFIPITIPTIPLFIWLKPAINKLKFKNDRIPDIYLFVCWVTMFLSLMFSIKLMKTVISTITKVENISELNNHDKSAYYYISEYELSNNLLEKSYSSYTSGQYNQHLNINLFFTVPIVNKNEKLIEPKNYKVWMCQKFKTKESNRNSNQEINRIFRLFQKNTDIQYSNQKKPKYFKRLYYSEQKIQALKAIEKIQPGFNQDKIIILSPLWENPKKSLKKDFLQAITVLSVGIVFFLLILIAPKLKKSRNKASSKIKDTDLSELLSLIIPKKGTKVITPILLWINIIVFIVTVL